MTPRADSLPCAAPVRGGAFAGACMDVLHPAIECGDTDHGAAFPQASPRRLIELLTEQDVISPRRDCTATPKVSKDSVPS
jgi:hypothetical protein